MLLKGNDIVHKWNDDNNNNNSNNKQMKKKNIVNFVNLLHFEDCILANPQ